MSDLEFIQTELDPFYLAIQPNKWKLNLHMSGHNFLRVSISVHGREYKSQYWRI